MMFLKPALRRVASLLAFAWILTSSLEAAEYYVSTNGSDSAIGSQASPWKTIQRAATLMTAGDTAIVLPGVYNERITTKADGDETNRITFRAASTNVFCKGFYVTNDFVTIDGFSMTNGYFSPWEFDGAIKLHKTADYCWLLNNRFLDFEKVSTSTNRFTCILFDFSSKGALGQQYCIVSNNWFRNTTYIQLKLGGAYSQVVNNVFEDANERDAIHVFGRGHRIASNVFTNFQSDSIIQDHCDIFQTFGDEDVESFEMLIEQNLIINCQGAQLCQLEQKGRPNIRDWTFRNNVWINLGMAANIDIENCEWINNTFYRCTRNTGHTLLLNDNAKGTARNAVILNNIFYECGSLTNSPDYGYYGAETTNFPFVANHNFVCGANGAIKSVKYFRETQGINGGDPLFRSAQQGDLRLQSSSPLTSKGKVQSEFAVDFQGNLRSHNSWEIGAFESTPAASIISNEGAAFIQFIGEPNADYVLQTSEDLVNWNSEIISTASEEGLLQFEDSDMGTPKRFYRVIRL